MPNDNVVKLIQPGILTDRLTEVLRDGARALLTQAVEAEVSELLAATADLKTDDGCRRVVRHGHLSERRTITGIGPVAVRQPRVRDREASRQSGNASASRRQFCRLRPAFEEPRYADPDPLSERRVDRRLWLLNDGCDAGRRTASGLEGERRRLGRNPDQAQHSREPEADRQRDEVRRGRRCEFRASGYDLDPTARTRSEDRQANVRTELSADRGRLRDKRSRRPMQRALFDRLFSPPDIVAAVLAGKQPAGLTANKLMADTRLRFNFTLLAALWVWPSTRRSRQSCCRLFCVRSARANGH